MFDVSIMQAVAPELRAVALKLLRSLWMGRHDAALIALRAEKNFWTNITEPLFNSKQNVSIGIVY